METDGIIILGDKMGKVIITNEMKQTIDLMYPVGHTMVRDHDPSLDYPWQQWKSDCLGRALLGAGWTSTNTTSKYGNIPEGRTFTAGECGGEYEHTLTANEMPAHIHATPKMYVRTNNGDYLNTNSIGSLNGWDINLSGNNVGESRSWVNENTTSSTGGGSTHNNVMPYQAFYVWTRVA